ncbi:MAG: hypothetical protein EB101_01250 [Chitinophagia bacterium]|nr:hypothetical protein [Chitinophagia bacterium]
MKINYIQIKNTRFGRPCQPKSLTEKLCTNGKFYFKNHPPLANLATEFNGLVSKGSVERLALCIFRDE